MSQEIGMAQVKHNVNMDLIFNTDARFTKWAVDAGPPGEPLVVIDVGVQGGEHVRWDVFGEDRVVVYGFDAIREVIDRLGRNARPNRHYRWCAIGNEDGETQFYFNAPAPYGSSLLSEGAGASLHAVERRNEVRRVPIRRLDSLLEAGEIPQPDFLKIDVEGSEEQVLLGAKKLLATELLGLEVETNLNVSPEYPRSHFGALLDLATRSGLRALDLNFNRVPTRSFQQTLEKAGRAPVTDERSVGKVSMMNVLFFRDLALERVAGGAEVAQPAPLKPDKIVKAMMVLESYGLNDIALDIAHCHRKELSTVLDVDTAMQLLANPDCRVAEEVNAMSRSLSWKITAPLRAARRLLTSS